jgi:ssDNA-binding Zn-finger/Zn-ribbon topoisomerase 1
MPSGFGTTAPASWFQVNCPSCTAALQVRLAEGSWPVACSQALKCHAIFTVKARIDGAERARVLCRCGGEGADAARRAAQPAPNVVPRPAT